MPSSSNRRTNQESRMIDCYKAAFAGLYHVGHFEAANDITMWYMRVLDVDGEELAGFAINDSSWWADMKRLTDHTANSDIHLIAAGCLASTSDLLKHFGRAKEARLFDQGSQELVLLYEEIKVDEENKIKIEEEKQKLSSCS